MSWNIRLVPGFQRGPTQKKNIYENCIKIPCHKGKKLLFFFAQFNILREKYFRTQMEVHSRMFRQEKIKFELWYKM